jgi:hypothetical protein
MKETEEFALSMNNVTLIAIDEYAKRDVKPTQAVPYPSRVTPIITQCVGGENYIVRVHRRVGEDRLLTEMELKNWADRLKNLNPRPKNIYFLWNTNFEMQPFENATKLEALLPKEQVMNWKEHYMSVQKSNPGSIFAFFGASPKKGAPPLVKKKEEEKEKEEEEEEGGQTQTQTQKKAPAPAPVKNPKAQKKAKTSDVAAGLQAQAMNSFFKKK